MELDVFVLDMVLPIALMAFLASLGHGIGRFCNVNCPAVSKAVAWASQRLSGLGDDTDTFYCFFKTEALYGK